MKELKDRLYEEVNPVMEINDIDLRDKVIEAWGMSLSLNGFNSVDELPPREINGFLIKESVFTNSIAKTAAATADMLLSSGKLDFSFNRDNLIAAALCHSTGRSYLGNKENIKKWKTNVQGEGNPSFQYPMYSAYIAKRVGMPEDVVHCCWTHPYPATGYGNKKWKRSFNSNLLCTIINGFVKINIFGNIINNSLFA
jgi:hypothetical protein